MPPWHCILWGSRMALFSSCDFRLHRFLSFCVLHTLHLSASTELLLSLLLVP